MRIHYVIPSCNIGGAETMLLTLIDELDQERFTPSVCVIGGGPLLHELARRGVLTYTLPPFIGFLDFGFLIRFLRIVRMASPQLIHSHVWAANYYSSFVGRFLGIPVVSTFHSMNEVKTLKERMALKILVHFSSEMVFVCGAQRRHFGAAVTIKMGRVVYNGLRTVSKPSKVGKAEIFELQKACGLIPGDPVVTCVASLRPVKGHSLLLEGWVKIAQKFPRARLILLGDGQCRDSLEGLCARLNITDSVLFMGNRSEVDPYLAITDVFVSPSLSECLSYAIMEAMSWSCPIVASNVGGNSELIVHGESGLLVPTPDPIALAEAVCSLLSDRDGALKLGRSGRLRLASSFTASIMSNKYSSLYRGLIQE